MAEDHNTFKEKLIWSGNVVVDGDEKKIRMDNLNLESILLEKELSCSQDLYTEFTDEREVWFFMVPSHLVKGGGTVNKKFVALNVKKEKWGFIENSDISDRPCMTILAYTDSDKSFHSYLGLNFLGEYVICKSEHKFDNFDIISAEGDFGYFPSPFNERIIMPTYYFGKNGTKENSIWKPVTC